MFDKIKNYLTGCPTYKPLVADDDMFDTLFKHHRTGVIYRYIGTARDKTRSDDVVVVYQDTGTEVLYVRTWNEFFGSIGPNSNRRARFEKQD